ncbi:TPA: GrpB family protein [Clostridioides difficile]|nr:GrpB family protein [Clostridioides difficile]HBF0205960.1 GrpB family protein [Clostridioides difficile]HBF0691685.1 GrpB family protein [Clostridioides difficile]HBF0780190.1 GrpB family protein [Clostridioides difficile]HBH1798202.1 GrpB family protein [Clostridioides difficile]
MIGLKCGMVKLLEHQMIWDKSAKDVIILLKSIWDKTAIDIQHIGSTSIPSISAKPIIDIVVGVASLEEAKLYLERLEQCGIVFRGQDVPKQLLFAMGDFEKNTRTHHIHVVEWNSVAWNNYINFRDYLNTFTDKAKLYDSYKQKLALQFEDNRKIYTQRKQELINILLEEARLWRINT